MTVTQIVLVYEAISFAIIIMNIWIYYFSIFPRYSYTFRRLAYLARYLFESGLIFLLGRIIIRFTSNILRKMRYLEGILYVCASCKKIKDIIKLAPFGSYID